MSLIKELDAVSFQTVIQSETPALVDFWSPGCKPCGMLLPVLEGLAEENDGYAVVAKINAAEFPQIAAQFGIDLLPTLLFFHKGKVVERMSGVQSKHKLQNALDEIE
ncbi:MAG: thioredoxin family protein [Planctomycetaceae bacterium]|nr:thioredoxin family protein [Planctomycetaceae bacterium]